MNRWMDDRSDELMDDEWRGDIKQWMKEKMDEWKDQANILDGWEDGWEVNRWTGRLMMDE